MGFKAITVNTAPEDDPHILAEDDAAIYQGIFGGEGILDVGSRMEATIISNNQVRVADGVLVVAGHIGRNAYADYQDMTIENGAAGKKRNDLIVARFSTTGTGGIDNYTLDIIKGVPDEKAIDPEITQQDIYAGGKLREVPLYRVKLDGINITAVECLCDVIPTISNLQKKIDGLGEFSSVSTRAMPQYTANSYINLNTDKAPGDALATYGADGSITINQDMIAIIHVSVCGAPIGGGRAWIRLKNRAADISLGHAMQYGEYVACNISRIVELKKGMVLGVQIGNNFRLNDGGFVSFIEIIKLK